MAYYDVPQGRYVNLGASCEKRRGAPAVPLNLLKYFTRHQMRSLRQMENFGWHLAFVRRKESHFPSAVVINEGLSQIGVLDEDGSINTSMELDVRGSEPKRVAP